MHRLGSEYVSAVVLRTHASPAISSTELSSCLCCNDELQEDDGASPGLPPGKRRRRSKKLEGTAEAEAEDNSLIRRRQRGELSVLVDDFEAVNPQPTKRYSMAPPEDTPRRKLAVNRRGAWDELER